MLVCEEIGIPREKFFEIALTSMQEISDDLGLWGEISLIIWTYSKKE